MNNKWLSKSLLTRSLVGISLILTPILCFPERNISYSSKKNTPQSEINLFKNNGDVKRFFLNKHEENLIKISNASGKAHVMLDSYQQSNKLSHTNPNTKIDFRYNTVVYAKNDFVWVNSLDTLINKLNNYQNNYWQYIVSDWEATAGQRYMGNVVLVPMYAPKVHDHHEKKYIKIMKQKIWKNLLIS